MQDKSFLQKLLDNEKALIRLVLLQTLEQIVMSSKMTELTVDSIVKLVKMSKEAQNDTEFESIEAYLDRASRGV